MVTNPAPAVAAYPLSTGCLVCSRRAWRVYGVGIRPRGERVAYRCAVAHISWKDPRRPVRTPTVEASPQGLRAPSKPSSAGEGVQTGFYPLWEAAA